MWGQNHPCITENIQVSGTSPGHCLPCEQEVWGVAKSADSFQFWNTNLAQWMETRGKNGLCAVSCSLKFIFWENLKLECRSRWNWAGMLTGAQRDSGPVQSRGDFRKLWWCNCVVAIENSLARMANFYFESHWAPLSAIKHLRICYVLEKLLPHRVRPEWWKYTVTSSLKALNVAGFFLSQGFLAGLKA